MRTRSAFIITFLWTSLAANAADITFLGSASIPGNALDKSGLPGNILSNDGKDTGTPHAVFGGAGSAIDYTGADNLYLMAPDRGPNNGDAKYLDRVQYVRIEISPGAPQPVKVTNTKTSLLINAAGQNFTGSAAAFDGRGGAEALRLDPEGIRMAKDPAAPPGSFWISDEYGPYVYHFDRDGKKIGGFPLPAKYAVPHPSANSDKELSENKTGRQANRGLEGLAITPDGKTLVGMMQSPLIQDHGLDPALKRIGELTRIITMNLADSTTREYVYAFDSSKSGISEILALNDHEFLVLERDSTLGAQAIQKKIFRIDLTGATDISKPITAAGKTYDYTGTTADNGLPVKGSVPGVTTVTKKPFLDLLNPTYGLAGPNFPEKLEGLAWGPDFDNGDKLLIITSDNDFILEAPSYFYAFRISALAPEIQNRSPK